MILLQEPRTIKGVIRCPYHSCCYSTFGKLVSTPHVGGPGQNTQPDIDRSTLGLKEVRSTLWFDVVWINLSGDAEPFDCAMADLKRHWAEFDRPIYHAGQDSQIELTVKINWKLAVENYYESYHLPWVHPGLSSYSRLEDHYNIEQTRFYSGQGTRVYQEMRDQNDRCFPFFEGLSDKWQAAAEYIAVYPNVLMGVHRDHTLRSLSPQGAPKKPPNIYIFTRPPQSQTPRYGAATGTSGKKCLKRIVLSSRARSVAVMRQILMMGGFRPKWIAARIVSQSGWRKQSKRIKISMQPMTEKSG